MKVLSIFRFAFLTKPNLGKTTTSLIGKFLNDTERFYNMTNDETIITFHYHRICGLLNVIFCG